MVRVTHGAGFNPWYMVLTHGHVNKIHNRINMWPRRESNSHQKFRKLLFADAKGQHPDKRSFVRVLTF